MHLTLHAMAVGLLLAPGSVTPRADTTLPDGFVAVAPGQYIADGSLNPQAIEPSDFFNELKDRVLAQQLLDLDLGDAALLGGFLYEENRERILAMKRHQGMIAGFCDQALDPERIGRAFNRHLANERQQTNQRWGLLLGRLSGEGRLVVETLLADEVIPRVQASRIDPVVIWRQKPDRLVRMLESSCNPSAPAEQTIEQTGNVVIVSSSYSAHSSDEDLETLARRGLYTYAQIVECALIEELVAEHGIDLSSRARERLAGKFADEQIRKAIEAQPVISRRAGRIAEALEAVQTGASVDVVFDDFDLAEAGFDLETWRQYSEHTSPERAAQLFAAPAALDPTRYRAELLTGPLVTHALLERALAPPVCPTSSLAGPDPFPCRPDWLAECLPEVRDWYVADAQARVPEGPEGWTEWLQLFRP